jgi:hypothetical protein
VLPGTEPLPYMFLDPFFGRFRKRSRPDVLRIRENRAGCIPNERKLISKTRTPITNSKMKPNAKPIVRRQPAIHRLRQKIRHVLCKTELSSRSRQLLFWATSCAISFDQSHLLSTWSREIRRTLILFYGSRSTVSNRKCCKFVVETKVGLGDWKFSSSPRTGRE